MSVVSRAAMKGFLPVFKQLLSYGCDLDAESYIVHDSNYIYLASPLHVAAAYNRKDIVRYILEK